MLNGQWLRVNAARVLVAAGIVTAALVAPAAAGQAATQSDLARLEASVTVVTQQITAMKKIDPSLATQSAQTMSEIQDDLTYLKVKQRKEGNVTSKDVKDLADRIETLRVRTQASKISAQPMMDETPVERVFTVPVGTEMDVRLQTPLNSATAKVEMRFEATTLVDVVSAGEVVIPAGSIARGFVSSVKPSGRIDRRGSLTLSFDEMVVNGKHPPMRASLVQAMEGKMGEDAGRITAGAAVGAILGGIIGGGKGALAGVLIGGGGTVAATDGANADLPVGTILRIRLDQKLEVTMPGKKR